MKARQGAKILDDRHVQSGPTRTQPLACVDPNEYAPGTKAQTMYK